MAGCLARACRRKASNSPAAGHSLPKTAHGLSAAILNLPSQPQPMPKDTTRARNAALREFHELGLQVMAAERKCPPRGSGRYHYGSVARVARKTRRPHTYLHTARKFAALYPTKRDLDAICRLGASQGNALTTRHVMRLVTVKDKQQRNRLAMQCAAKGWSVSRLNTAIRGKRPKRYASGRRPPRPHDLDEALVTLEQMATHWVRWINVLKSSEGTPGVAFQDLPAGVRRPLSQASKNVERVLNAVGRQLK